MQQTYDALLLAVSNALETKRKLGQYPVIWKNGKIQTIPPQPTQTSVPQSDT